MSMRVGRAIHEREIRRAEGIKTPSAEKLLKVWDEMRKHSLEEVKAWIMSEEKGVK